MLESQLFDQRLCGTPFIAINASGLSKVLLTEVHSKET